MFLFCKPVTDKRRFSPFRKLSGDLTFTLYEKAHRVPENEWKQVLGSGDVFLELGFLSVIEKSVGLYPRYAIVHKNKKPCGIIYFQVVDYKAGLFRELIEERAAGKKGKDPNIFSKYITRNKEQVLMRVVTCGNNLLSGEHGYWFDDEWKKEDVTALVMSISDVVGREDKLSGTISAVLIKDFSEPLEPAELLKKEKYVEFKVEPNMKLQIPEGVKTIEEYITLFSKKYRNRAKGILKTCAEMKIRELSEEEIAMHSDKIYVLYNEVYSRSAFRLLQLPLDYFAALKKTLGAKFHITAFFREDKMIAFASYILRPNKELEAHYIGFDYELNKEFDLYQYILYCNIRSALAHQCKTVNFGRTAAEIKSTVGAKAEDLYCYARPQNTLSKLMMRPLISFLEPSEWTPRNPFKEEAATEEVKVKT
jgi:hypothetical protein